jgi:hypothetical protein
MTEIDHEGPGIISEHRRGWSLGSPADDIKDMVCPIVALLDVRLVFVTKELVRWCAFLGHGAITKIDSADRQNIVISGFSIYTVLHECIKSEVIS